MNCISGTVAVCTKPNLFSGTFDPDKEEYAENDEVTLTCDEDPLLILKGATINADNVIVCQSDTSWKEKGGVVISDFTCVGKI